MREEKVRPDAESSGMKDEALKAERGATSAYMAHIVRYAGPEGEDAFALHEEPQTPTPEACCAASSIPRR